MSQSRENVWMDGRTDGQTVFYRTLPAETGGPTTGNCQIFKIAMTRRNNLSFVIKRNLP